MSSSSADADAPATLTHPRPDVWVITLNAPPDNRLTPKMLLTLNKLVDQVEAQWRTENKTNKALGGALVITSGIRKFFSNGFVPEILMQPGFGDGELR
jgi:enoyl-CoA hydratase/carnithine racemase